MQDSSQESLDEKLLSALVTGVSPLEPPPHLRERILRIVHRHAVLEREQHVPKPKDLLVDVEWLDARLDSPSLRVIDCTVWLEPQPVGPSHVRDGRGHYEAGHIPGAAYLHLVEDLSDPNGSFPFALPRANDMQARLGELGINTESTVVLYGAGTPWVVTRAWWVLHASGLSRVCILDGGWNAWVEAGKPVTQGSERFEPVEFRSEPKPSMVAGKADVESSLEDDQVCLLSALSPEQFAGTGGPHYGRRGRIPGSINVPVQRLFHDDSGRYKSRDELAAIFDASGIDRYEKVITYCGGGVNASMNYFALSLLGYENVALYDGSLLEWCQDPGHPMETD